MKHATALLDSNWGIEFEEYLKVDEFFYSYSQARSRKD